MSTYKVIQDIEAEDHILGPLSLRQFIYALVSAFFLYLCFICLTKHAVFLLVLFLPPAIFTGFFAFPFGKDQPTEVWALAKLRFLFKPRRRIWNQSGVKELVTITVPKKIELHLTNGLNQTEVKSRLEALANTIDSRGWAIKNVSAAMYSQPGSDADSDRLINLAAAIKQWFTHPPLGMPNGKPATSATASPLAASSSPMTYQLPDSVPGLMPKASDPTPNETALAAEARQHLAAGAEATANLHTLQPTEPASDQSLAMAGSPLPVMPQDSVPATAPAPAQPTSPTPTDPVILKLATNNDLNVATLAREAGKVKDLDGSGDEVVIALH
jgi:hypothetical protein